MGLGSGIRRKPIPDPGIEKAPDSESRVRNTGLQQIIARLAQLMRIGKDSMAGLFNAYYGICLACCRASWLHRLG
jgi:hypothetical protein